tara:strand:- start:95 stop:1159 length:1065 start_codon:yes stop_codon:yes gene_type:complete
MKIIIKNKIISDSFKTYFIADIGANHDGSLKRAKKLIKLAALSGADAAKFQHFKAETIVNKETFDKQKKSAHQAKWKSSIFNVYKKASINISWNEILKKECKKNKIHFLTSPYDLDYIEDVNKLIPAYKIGSGDITWKQALINIAKKKKPVFLATGASSLKDVISAAKKILKINKKLVIMQCNTNYTNSEENFKYINLNVLKTYKRIFGKKVILGLSDHTEGHTTVLGAISLGAKVIEKHFTDNNNRNGPDHKFAMNPTSWKKMVDESRRLELALGSKIKKIEKNEKESFFVQRRGVYTLKKLKKGEKLNKEDVICLRPYIKNTISPFDINKFFGKKLKQNIKKNVAIKKKWLS